MKELLLLVWMDYRPSWQEQGPPFLGFLPGVCVSRLARLEGLPFLKSQGLPGLLYRRTCLGPLQKCNSQSDSLA